jgi:hypothetical protein
MTNIMASCMFRIQKKKKDIKSARRYMVRMMLIT